MIYKFKSWIDIDKFNWYNLSRNKNAVHILEKKLDEVNWNMSTENASHILEKKLDKVHWNMLSSNKNAVHILENNLDKVNWYFLSKNKNIFDYDYDKMKNITSVFKEELIAKAFHPIRFIKWLESGYDPSEL